MPFPLKYAYSYVSVKIWNYMKQSENFTFYYIDNTIYINVLYKCSLCESLFYKALYT